MGERTVLRTRKTRWVFGKNVQEKVVFIVYSLRWIMCISVESGTTAVRQRITLKYSFHWSRGQTSEAFSFDLKISFKVNFTYLKTNSNLQSEKKYIDLLSISFCFKLELLNFPYWFFFSYSTVGERGDWSVYCWCGSVSLHVLPYNQVT